MALRMKTPAVASRRATVQVKAAWQKTGVTQKQVAGADGARMVVEISGQRVLLAESSGQIYAVSNKCSHLGLPLVGKTALMQGKVTNGCITCPSHGTAFDLATGEVKGKWCPSLPDALSTGFGLTPKKPLPTFQSRVNEDGSVEVNL